MQALAFFAAVSYGARPLNQRHLSIGRDTPPGRTMASSSASSAAQNFPTVVALTRKAGALERKGHLLPAAEKYGQAVAALEACHPEYDVIGAELRISHARMVLSASSLPGVASLADSTAMFMSCHLHILPPARAALERRRLAGTLLPGALGVAEETAAATVLNANAENGRASLPAALAGLSAYLMAALLSLSVLDYTGSAAELGTEIAVPGEATAGLPDERVVEVYAYVAEALDLVTLPREVLNDAAIGAEVSLYQEMVRIPLTCVATCSDSGPTGFRLGSTPGIAQRTVG